MPRTFTAHDADSTALVQISKTPKKSSRHRKDESDDQDVPNISSRRSAGKTKERAKSQDSLALVPSRSTREQRTVGISGSSTALVSSRSNGKDKGRDKAVSNALRIKAADEAGDTSTALVKKSEQTQLTQYQILGLQPEGSKTISASDVKTRYKKLSERLKKAMDEEEDKDERKRLRGQIREMRAACAMLSDPVLRSKYDAFLRKRNDKAASSDSEDSNGSSSDTSQTDSSSSDCSEEDDALQHKTGRPRKFDSNKSATPISSGVSERVTTAEEHSAAGAPAANNPARVSAHGSTAADEMMLRMMMQNLAAVPGRVRGAPGRSEIGAPSAQDSMSQMTQAFFGHRPTTSSYPGIAPVGGYGNFPRGVPALQGSTSTAMPVKTQLQESDQQWPIQARPSNPGPAVRPPVRGSSVEPVSQMIQAFFGTPRTSIAPVGGNGIFHRGVPAQQGSAHTATNTQIYMSFNQGADGQLRQTYGSQVQRQVTRNAAGEIIRMDVSGNEDRMEPPRTPAPGGVQILAYF